MPHACEAPAAIAVHTCEPATSTGVGCIVAPPGASSPNRLSPQQRISPANTAHDRSRSPESLTPSSKLAFQPSETSLAPDVIRENTRFADQIPVPMPPLRARPQHHSSSLRSAQLYCSADASFVQPTSPLASVGTSLRLPSG